MMVGDKGAGKTTLSTRLLFEDAAIFGDEKVLVQGRKVMPFPRKFHLKEGTLPLIPQLGAIWNQRYSYPTANGMRMCFFDPLDVGAKWKTEWGRVDTIFYLEPNHGRPTQIQSCPTWMMAQKLILQATDFGINPESQIAELCRMASESENFMMHIGELDRAAAIIEGILS